MELNVVAHMRIMPEGIESDFDSIKKGVETIVSKYGKVHSSEVKPLAFGLKAMEVIILLSDKQGGMDEIETEISKLHGVGGVETTDVNRL